MVYADLHVHTRRSDGTLTPETIPDAARAADVEVVAVTDHDRYHPDFGGPVLERDGITLIHGIELRVEAPVGRVDLLGFGLEPTADLRAEVDRIQRDRRERGRAIVECVEDCLGVELDVEIREGLGRPHVARAIDDHPDTDVDYDAAFAELIGNDEPCFVARDVPSFDRGRAILDEACGIVGLAHPFRYEDPEAAVSLTADLDAVERYYPYGRPIDESLVEDAVREHDLLVTGGSDAHDRSLGSAGLSAADYERLADFVC
ncbi:MAG: putative metal-dependent phosphoesterase TrpH [Halobacteriales archaeon]|jgi:predicted metal-dependent phosphoesterase TrpH